MFVLERETAEEHPVPSSAGDTGASEPLTHAEKKRKVTAGESELEEGEIRSEEEEDEVLKSAESSKDQKSLDTAPRPQDEGGSDDEESDEAEVKDLGEDADDDQCVSMETEGPLLDDGQGGMETGSPPGPRDDGENNAEGADSSVATADQLKITMGTRDLLLPDPGKEDGDEDHGRGDVDQGHGDEDQADGDVDHRHGDEDWGRGDDQADADDDRGHGDEDWGRVDEDRGHGDVDNAASLNDQTVTMETDVTHAPSADGEEHDDEGQAD